MTTQVFIPADEADKEPPPAEEQALIIREPWEDTLTDLANQPGKTVRVPRNPDVKRKQVVNAFQDAFELIGGTPRLAIWANDNPGEFYKLFSKLAPRQIEQESKHEGGVTIRHVLPRGKLDE